MTSIAPFNRNAAWVAQLSFLTAALTLALLTDCQAAGSVAHGRELFSNLGCTSCHGTQGQGGNARPGVPAPKIANTSLSFADFTHQIRCPRGVMPAFPAAFASDRDLADIYAYLTSADGKQAAAAPVTPMAPTASPDSAMRGKILVVKMGCYECHDYAGEGSVFTGPSLSPNPLPYAAFAAQVRIPRQYMPPYPAKFLSNGELGDIYAYVLSLPPPPPLKNLPLLTNR